MLAICIHHFCTYRVVLILIVSAIIMHSILLHLSTSLMSPMRALPNSLGNGNNGCRKMHVSLRVLSVILHLCTDPIFSVLVHYLQYHIRFRAFLWGCSLIRFKFVSGRMRRIKPAIKQLPSVGTLHVYGYVAFLKSFCYLS